METRDRSSGFSSVLRGMLASPLSVTATVCVVALVALLFRGIASNSNGEYAIAAQPAAVARTANNPVLLSSLSSGGNDIATSDIAMVGPTVIGELVAQYQRLKDTGSYTPEAAGAAAEQLAQNISVPVPYTQYTLSDIQTSSDTSYSAMLAYRAKLRSALAPMRSIKDLEIAVFAKYAETKSPAYMQQLRSIIATYNNAIAAAAALTVPQDAVAYHAGILNAMGQFSATLEALADNAGDPITVVTLLRTYSDAENAMVTSFNSLAHYYANHPRP